MATSLTSASSRSSTPARKPESGTFPSPPNARNPRSDSLGKPPETDQSSRILKRALALFLIVSGPLAAQVPRAAPVDPALTPDAGNDQFQRGKNIYDSAQASTVQASRVEYFQRAAQIFN